MSCKKSQRRQRLKRAIIEVCGGCKECNYKNPVSLEFHHINPDIKKYNIPQILHLSWNNPKLSAELRKCVILCANCHNEVHEKGTSLKYFKLQWYPNRSPVCILRDSRNSKLRRIFRIITFREEFID